MTKVYTAEEILSRGVRVLSAEDLLKPKDGRDGKDGPAGPSGKAGRDGRDGQGFNWRGNFKDTERYYKNDVVNYLGSTYIAIRESIRDYPNRVNNGWDLMAAAGATGSGGSGGTSLTTTYTEVTTTPYTVQESSLVDGYNIYGINTGQNATVIIPANVDPPKFITIKNTMDSFTVTIQTA